MKPIRFGVVGCGRISGKHFDAILHADHAELTAVSDAVPALLHKAMSEYKVKGYADYRELLASPEVDVVDICTPSGLHAEMAIAAAKAGKHVVLEKPIALNSRDAQKIMRAFERSGTTLAVVFQNRYNRAVQFVKEREPKLGRLNYLTAQVYWYREQRYYSDVWHGTRAMDGGVLTNQGSHYADLLLYFKQKPVESVSAFGATLGHKMECEDVITVNVRFADGSLGNIQANTIAYPKNYEGSFTFFYDRATIKIGGPALNEIAYWKGELEDDVHQIHAEHIDNIYGNGHRKVIQNVVNALRGIEPLFIPGKAGVGPVRLIEAAYRSMETGSVINLSSL